MHLPNNRVIEFTKFTKIDRTRERERDNATNMVGDIVKSKKIQLTIPSKDFPLYGGQQKS